MASSSKYSYIPLSELGQHIKGKVNVFGVVTGQPLRSVQSTTNFKQETILICDESTGLHSPIRCTIRIYNRSEIHDYNTPSAGTIVRLHRMSVMNNNGILAGFLHQSEDMIQFLINNDSITRSTTATSYTFDGQDDRKAMELHRWYQRTRTLPVPVHTVHRNLRTFCEILKDGYYDVCVEVIGWSHDEKLYQRQMVVRVWDGTKPHGKPTLSKLPPDVYGTLRQEFQTLETDYFVDVIVFDEHITPAHQLKAGDHIFIQNVKVMFKGGTMQFWLQSGGKSFARGIWPVKNDELGNTLRERLHNVIHGVRDNASQAMDDELITITENVSDFEMVDEQRRESAALDAAVSQNIDVPDAIPDAQEKRNVEQAGLDNAQLDNTQQKKTRTQSPPNPFSALADYNQYFKAIPRPN